MTSSFPTPATAIHHWASVAPDVPALKAPGAEDISFNQLACQLQSAATQLSAMGYGAESRLALVLPQGILLASALLSLTAHCPVLPVNAAWSISEQSAIFKKANISALVTLPNFGEASRSAAVELKLPVIELIPTGVMPTGFFNLSGSPAPYRDASLMLPDSICLILPTSGTTGRLKLVPISGQQLTNSAAYMQEIMRLTPADRTLVLGSLNLMAAIGFCLLATLVSGGSAVITPFDSLKVINQVEQYRPTWIFTSPPMLHEIYEYLRAHPIPPAFKAMRFLRVSSAHFPADKIITLEKWLSIPVLHGYGMTEGISNNICNPLPPLVRKPETVGLPVYVEVAVFNEESRQLPVGEIGELALRGENLFKGYLNPEDNIPSPFVNGWFMTGDLATIDNDGYVTIVGRRKEMINSGGQKILPREVEEACMSHPDVAEACVVPLPHPTLGEQAAAAVVRRSEALTETALADHLKSTLAPYKVPATIVFVEQLPSSVGGKIQRQQVIELLQARVSQRSVSDDGAETGSELAIAILSLWHEVLGDHDITLSDLFIPAGGDSLTAVRLALRISEQHGVDFSVMDIFDFLTPSSQAAEINRRLNTSYGLEK